MVTWQQFLRGAIGHIFLLIINFSVFVAIIESVQIIVESSSTFPILNLLVLGYMVIHTFLMLSLQLGIQVLELIRIHSPTVLVTYYFKFSDEETIPLQLLDPTKSKLAVIVLLLVISGGPILYPIYAIFGFFLISGYLTIIVQDPTQIIGFFIQFLTWVPPLLLIAFGIIVVSIVMIEFKHR